MELRPHQEAALEKLSNGKILWGGVGTGKSFTAVKYYERKEAPRDVYVITTAKKRDSLDWEKEFAHIAVGKEYSVHGRLVVDSWNNISRYTNTTGAFFIFDEQRLVGSGAWVKAFVRIARRNHWILLSATPGDTWMDYVPVFVANGFYNNRTEFKREHVIYNSYAKFPKIDRYVGTGRLVKLRQQVLIEMPYVRETLRDLIDVEVPFDAKLLEDVTKRRWNVYEQRPIRDVGELYRVARQVVNADPRRLAKVAELVRTHPKLIIFYNFDYELEMLRSLWTTTMRTGSNDTGSMASLSEWSSSTFPPGSAPVAQQEAKGSELWSGDTTSPNPPTSTSGSTPPAESLTPSTSTGSTSASHPPAQSDSRTTELWNESSSSNTTCSAEGDGTLSIPSSTAVAEWNGHKHQRIPLEHERWVYLVQYTAGAEGWNCTETDTMIFYSLTYSYKQFHQAQGRIDRLNTAYRLLTYYVLGGKSWIDLAIRKSLDQKRDFQEKPI